MFDSRCLADLRSSAEMACASRIELAGPRELTDGVRTVRAVIDVLEGLQAELLGRIDQVDAFELDGASSLAGWARREVRLDARQARALVKGGRTLSQLPGVRAALRDGSIRLDHVREFGLGVSKIGVELMAQAQAYLLPVAQSGTPSDLRGAVGLLAEAVHPDSLDEAWADGMDKADVQVGVCGDGYHLTGFLDIVTGAAFRTWLDAAAAPCDVDDKRSPSQRRVEAVRQLIMAALEHGLPSDRGIRPQLHVTVDLATLISQSVPGQTMPGQTVPGRTSQPPPGPEPVVEPAHLAGFGPIGADLLGYLRCDADATEVVIDGQSDGPTPQADVLNVGRRSRLATPQQRVAVRVRQGGHCAAPGCTNTHLELHHAAWWGRDHGPTDLDNLIGLCVRCHHLIHRDLLSVAADGHGGFVFARPTGRRLEDHRRQAQHRIRGHLAALRRSTDHPSRRALSHTRLDHRHTPISCAEQRLDVLLQPRPHIRT